MEDEKGQLLKKLIDAVNEISSISDYRCCVKRQLCNLARRLKLLTPMFEEIRESKEPLSDDALKSLAVFSDALDSTKDFLRFGREGSKIYLVYFLDSLKFFLSLYGHKLPVLCMDISSDGDLIVTGSADKNLKIWGLDFGDCHKSLFAHADSVMDVKFVRNTHYIFSVGKD